MFSISGRMRGLCNLSKPVDFIPMFGLYTHNKRRTYSLEDLEKNLGKDILFLAYQSCSSGGVVAGLYYLAIHLHNLIR